MMKGLKKLVLTTVMTTVIAFAATGCSVKEPTIEEKALNVIGAYQTGDVEKFQSYLESDSKMHIMMDAIDDTNAEGMVEVFQKVYELTKTAEVTVKESEEHGNEYATVTIKTVDFTDAIVYAMTEAINESGDAFADVPGWMMAALNTGGEAVETEVELRIKSSNSIYESFNEEFFNALTGGFYDYFDITMTSCFANNEYDDRTYLISKYDAVKMSVDEYVIPFYGEEYSDEEVQMIIDEYVASYEGYDGVLAGAMGLEDGIRFIVFVNYDVASSYGLQQLGFVSGYYDYISLSSTIEGLEGEGYTCETTDFGSGIMDK